MDPIYVTGHRNPDTDSIVAAMSYAALRNALGQREYEPACLGQVSDETQRVLDRFGFTAPRRITGMYTQVRDLAFDRPPILSSAVTVERAWELLQEDKMQAAIPVANEDGTLYGMLSREDVASYTMSQISGGVLEPVPLFNLLSVLEGRICNDAGENTDMISGEVVIALPQSRDILPFRSENTILLCGDQPEVMKAALEKNIHCLILCQAELPEELVSAATTTCVIGTDLDAYRASRMLFQSTPIGRICRREDNFCVHLEDRVDDVKELVLKHRQPCYPILNEREQVVGILARYHLLRPRRKRVVLVDHNEASQSVPGLEEAEILEIIDHHRLADIQTANPIYVRNEPVGSTNTIIASMYRDRGVTPTEGMAGMMAAAILSDTVMFKSPTCTERDRQDGTAGPYFSGGAGQGDLLRCCPSPQCQGAAGGGLQGIPHRRYHAGGVPDHLHGQSGAAGSPEGIFGADGGEGQREGLLHGAADAHRRVAGGYSAAVRGRRGDHPPSLQRGAQGQRCFPAQNYEPQKAGNSHAQCPVGIIFLVYADKKV